MTKLNPKLNALLLASSPYHANRSFSVCEEAAFRSIFQSARKVLFLPFSLDNHDEYTAFNKKLLNNLGYELTSLHEQQNKQDAIKTADGIFIGGGNTFRLLAALHELEIFGSLREKIAKGTPYLGTSAGATLFCPTIKTTNDMPIVSVPSLDAFGFLPFQINPHFPEDEGDGAAESRADRLHEFHEENAPPVLGIREGGFITLQNGSLELGGDKTAALFQAGRPDIEIGSAKSLMF